MRQDYQAILAAPFGALGIAIGQDRLACIDFLPAGTATMLAHNRTAAAVCSALADYLRDPAAPLDLALAPAGTPFQQRVWQVLRAILPGHVLTYGELAQKVGSSPRAVAQACGANPVPLVIPCHRVVARHDLGGFMQGRTPDALAIKRWLLAHERSKPAAA